MYIAYIDIGRSWFQIDLFLKRNWINYLLVISHMLEPFANANGSHNNDCIKQLVLKLELSRSAFSYIDDCQTKNVKPNGFVVWLIEFYLDFFSKQISCCNFTDTWNKFLDEDSNYLLIVFYSQWLNCSYTDLKLICSVCFDRFSIYLIC